MNLYEFEGKQLFSDVGIAIPKGETLTRFHDPKVEYEKLGIENVMVKAQVLSGKRGKNNAIRFCTTAVEVEAAVKDLFAMDVRGQYVAAVRIEEKLDIAEEHYLSITYDTNNKQPVLVYSTEGGVDIEDVADEKILRVPLDIRNAEAQIDEDIPYAQELWNLFLDQDCRLAEINPLVKTEKGEWIAADAKVALDNDAFYRHESWKELEPRTMMGRPPTDREIAVQKIDAGEKYYQGTAGKYIEMDGDIAILFSGGGASIANMDALLEQGLKPANYSEYSGNPPREKVYELAKIVLSKPHLRGLWIAGGVCNFTNVRETFHGIVDAIDELKPNYPIVVRRDGPEGQAGRDLILDCAKRNNLDIKVFGKEVSMSDTAKVLADMIKNT